LLMMVRTSAVDDNVVIFVTGSGANSAFQPVLHLNGETNQNEEVRQRLVDKFAVTSPPSCTKGAASEKQTGCDGSHSSGESERGGGSEGRGGGRSGRNDDRSNRSGGNIRKVSSVHETLYNQHREVLKATGLSKREIISKMKKGNVGASQMERFVSDLFLVLDQLQEEEKKENSWSQVSKKSVKKTSAQQQQGTGISGHGGSAQRGRGAMRGDGKDRGRTLPNQTMGHSICNNNNRGGAPNGGSCSGLDKQGAANTKAAKAKAQAQAAANKKAAKAKAQAQAAANKKAATAAAATAGPPAVKVSTAAAAAAAPDAAKTAARTQDAHKQAATKFAKEQKENPSKGINMGKWTQLAEQDTNFSFGDWDDDKDGKKKVTAAPACQMINKNENAVQFILRDCLNSVEKDGNFLHDETSHEVITDDVTSKEENGKGEGEKKKVIIIFFYRNIF